jgi:two-component system, OmpR family, response regulator
MRILLAEDDTEIATHVGNGLREAGYEVEHHADGASALTAAAVGKFDLLIVDRMLPQLEGLALIAALRGQGVATPVLVLSALGTVDHRVEGLKAGGDDYLVKPFALAELLARVEALLRRGSAAAGARGAMLLRVADLELDRVSRKVNRAGKPIDLTAREFKLLEYLMQHPGQVVTRTMLLENVWDLHFDPQTNLIDVHVSRLRQEIDRDFARPLLHTVRGAGYMFGDRP